MTMRNLTLISIAVLSLNANAGPLAKALQSAAQRSQQPASRAAAQSREAIRAAYVADRVRDNAKPAIALQKPLTVHRYTSSAAAEAARTEGLAPHTHFTGQARPGPALSPERAQHRYGLLDPPQARITVVLPAGQPVRRNSVLAGEPGAREVTSTKRVPASAVLEVVPLRSPTQRTAPAQSQKAPN
jgi:hypothetical protein